MSKRERQPLSIDLDTLFPGETLEIGSCSILIRPLSIEQIANLSKKITGLGNILTEKGVNWDNYDSPQNLFHLAVIILENFPEVLEEAANVSIDDLKVLPIEVIVQIVDKIIEVNLKSKEDLEKNFKSLTNKFIPKVKEEQKKPPLKKIKK